MAKSLVKIRYHWLVENWIWYLITKKKCSPTLRVLVLLWHSKAINWWKKAQAINILWVYHQVFSRKMVSSSTWKWPNGHFICSDLKGCDLDYPRRGLRQQNEQHVLGSIVVLWRLSNLTYITYWECKYLLTSEIVKALKVYPFRKLILPTSLLLFYIYSNILLRKE